VVPLYRVIEVANLLGVSKVTIYKKISLFKKELKPYIHKKRNITFIDEEGVQIIRDSLVANQVIADTALKDEQIVELKNEVDENEAHIKMLNEKMIDVQREHMEDLQLLISTLKAQVNLKRTQIDSKNQLIKNFKDLVAYNKEQIKRIESKISQIEN
tara:strand:+ start:276 stop:746 length:471 start_codon:yes stop_codon:yes gene_type:complete